MFRREREQERDEREKGGCCPPLTAHGQARRPGRGLAWAGAGGPPVAAGQGWPRRPPQRGGRENSRGAAAPLLTNSAPFWGRTAWPPARPGLVAAPGRRAPPADRGGAGHPKRRRERRGKRKKRRKRKGRKKGRRKGKEKERKKKKRGGEERSSPELGGLAGGGGGRGRISGKEKRERWEKLRSGEERGGDRERELRERLGGEGREGENLGEEEGRGGGAVAAPGEKKRRRREKKRKKEKEEKEKEKEKEKKKKKKKKKKRERVIGSDGWERDLMRGVRWRW